MLEEDLAGAYFNSGMEGQSKKYYEKAMQHFEESTTDHDPDLALSYEKVSRCYTWDFCKDNQKAFEYINNALKIRIENLSRIKQGEVVYDRYSQFRNYDENVAYSQIRSCLASVGKLFHSIGCYLTGLPYFIENYNSIKKNNFREQNNLSYALCNIARSCFEMGQSIHTSLEQEETPFTGWDNFYDVLMVREKRVIQKSIIQTGFDDPYSCIIRLCEGMIHCNADNIKESILTIFHDQYPCVDAIEIGAKMTEQDFYAFAKYFIDKAESIIQSKRGDSQVDAVTFKVLSADIYFIMGKTEDAHKMYQEALNIAEKILDKENYHLILLRDKLRVFPLTEETLNYKR